MCQGFVFEVVEAYGARLELTNSMELPEGSYCFVFVSVCDARHIHQAEWFIDGTLPVYCELHSTGDPTGASGRPAHIGLLCFDANTLPRAGIFVLHATWDGLRCHRPFTVE
jgi:hypothetical protein